MKPNEFSKQLLNISKSPRAQTHNFYWPHLIDSNRYSQFFVKNLYREFEINK